MYVGNWGADYVDPDNFLRTNLFRRSTRWRNETYEGLLVEARRVMDQGERMKRYELLLEIFVQILMANALDLVFWKRVRRADDFSHDMDPGSILDNDGGVKRVL